MARLILLGFAEEQRKQNILRIARRRLRDASDPLQLPEREFIANFRLDKAGFQQVLEELRPYLPQVRRKTAIRNELKILATLSFYANGSYQRNVGASYLCNMSQPAFSKCLHDVTDALNVRELFIKYVKFPSSRHEREIIMKVFMEKFGFPGIIGCIDGTHVALIRPIDHEEAYFNRKNYHSLNVLIVVRGVHIEPAHMVKKRSIDQPLRISIFYDHSVYRLEPEKFDMINNTILPEAVKFWERALKVRKTGGPIKLNRKCPTRQVFVRDGRTHCIDQCNIETMCGEVRVPEEHLNLCYVCNSTGHNCRALPRQIRLDDEAPSEIDGNSINDGTDISVTEDEEDFQGVEDTDFVLYVSAVETERCRRGQTVAYASHCQQESALDRPVAGHANFCPGELSTRYRDLPSVLSTVKHEMLHALGFSVSLFAFYRDENGDPLTERRLDTGNPPMDEELQIHKWSDRVVKNITRKNWMIRGGYMERTFNMIVTPRVVKEVREHFNCSELEGAELEDQGGDGTALTHWEKRVFENEAMTGTHTQNSVFSRITFALMEDTGWYRANYEHATPLDWGRGLGCRFSMVSCKQWLNSQRFRRKNPAPFCERIKGNPLRTECSPRRNAVVLCNLIRHDTILPRAYQHFDTLPNVPAGEEAHYGGSVSLADYCPYLQEFTWRHKSVLVRGSRCSYEENTPKTDVNFALENYGAHSKCFDHSDKVWEQKSCRQIREWQHWGSGCYKYKCEGGRLHIVVGNYSYTCFHASQVLQIRIIKRGWLHKGGVVCPPCRELCGEEFASRNEYCKGGEEPLPPNLYPNDALTCSAVSLTSPAIFITTILFLIFNVIQ